MWPSIAKQFTNDLEKSTKVTTQFGIEFPSISQKGEFFIRTDYIPTRLYKFNGSKWITVDKNKTDVYLDNDKYIKFLSEKLQNGEYEIDQLSTAEQDAVAELIQRTT